MNNKLINSLAVTLCVLVTIGLLAWGGNNYYKYREALEVKLQKEQERETLKKEIIQLNKSIELYAKETDNFAKLLFNERDVPAFLDGIAKSAKDSKVNILQMKTQKFQEVKVPDELSASASNASKLGAAAAKKTNPANNPDAPPDFKKILTLSAMPIHMEVEGEFESLVTFLGELEAYRQLLTVTNVEIDVQRDYPILRCKFTLRIYSLKSLEDLKEK